MIVTRSPALIPRGRPGLCRPVQVAAPGLIVDRPRRASPAAGWGPIQAIDSYDIANQNEEESMYSGGDIGKAQCITLAQPTWITGVAWDLRKQGSPTGTIYANLYAVSGTVGSTAVPTGSALATAALDVSTLDVGFALVWFAFAYKAPAGGIALNVEYSGGDISNRPFVGIDTTSPAHGGNYAANGGAWAAAAAVDAIFSVIGRPAI